MNLIPPRPIIPQQTVPPLYNGDRLTQAEFHRRYEAYPKHVKAELIGGIVYMASPLRQPHGENHVDLSFLLNLYKLSTPGLALFDNTTVILGEESELQPDLSLRIVPAHGGQSGDTPERYIAGAPEFVAEVAHSSVAIDLHTKFGVYEQAGVREYLVLCLDEQEAQWFDFPNEATIEPNRQGVSKSLVFPGLWLDLPALLRRDMPQAIAVTQQGLASRPHAAFAKRLAAARKRRPDQGAP
jgi:Uma2 family endonuclease